MGELRNVLVKTLDSHQFPLTLNALTRVGDIKTLIHTQTSIPMLSQRLLYKGRLLKDHETLDQIGFSENDSLYFVGNVDSEDGPLTALANLTAVNNLNRLRRSRARRRELTAQQIAEVLRQSLYVIDDLSIETQRNGYELSKRNLREGQWVDVLDTVNQWLDAQIMQLRTTRSGTRALIHYIGWPENWDEWIKTDSNRIMPFRSKTKQILGSVMQSPFPALIPYLRSPGIERVSEMVLKSSLYIDDVKGFLDQYKSLMLYLNSTEQVGHDLRSPISLRKDEEEAETELEDISRHSAPILDRVGRLMTDLGFAISKDSSARASLVETSEDLHVSRFVFEGGE